MAWNNPDVKLLISMWKRGKSMREMREALNGITKSAIVGKIHRLGLSNRNELTERDYTMAMNEVDMCMNVRETLLDKRKEAYDRIRTFDAIPTQIIHVEAYLKLLKEVERLRSVVTELSGEKFNEYQAKRKKQSDDWANGRAANGFPTRQDGLPHRDS